MMDRKDDGMKRRGLPIGFLSCAGMAVGMQLGCLEGSDEIGGAMIAAAAAARSQIPEELESRGLRLSDRWTIDIEGADPLIPAVWLAGVQKVTGYPVVSLEDVEVQESEIAILSFHQPPEESGDSLMIYMDWIGWRGGDAPGVWGRTNRYLFDCSSRPCRLEGITFWGSWN